MVKLSRTCEQCNSGVVTLVMRRGCGRKRWVRLATCEINATAMCVGQQRGVFMLEAVG